MSEVDKVYMNVGEIMDLARWVEQKGLAKNHRVEISFSHTGIGTAIQALTKMTETEGIFVDITDYDCW